MNAQQKLFKKIFKKAGLVVARDTRSYIGGTCYELTITTSNGREFTFYNDGGLLGLYGDYTAGEEKIFLTGEAMNEHFIDIFKLFTPDELARELPTTDNFISRDTAGEELMNDLANGYTPEFTDDTAINALI